jgi:deoxyribonuclease IV
VYSSDKKELLKCIPNIDIPNNIIIPKKLSKSIINKNSDICKSKLIEYFGDNFESEIVIKYVSIKLSQSLCAQITSINNTILYFCPVNDFEKDIDSIMLRVFTLYCLSEEYTTIVLILPIQGTIIVITDWEQRVEYRTKVISMIESIKNISPTIDQILYKFNIGHHTNKENTLVKTVNKLDSKLPYQIFLGGNQSTSINLDSNDIKETRKIIDKNNIKLFVHSPYIINLSTNNPDNWQNKYLIKLLEKGIEIGVKGIVIHTGKHTKDSYEIGVSKMRDSINKLLEHATPECPILLETPAGQGTETLQKCEEFIEFIESFGSKNIYACVDTCHVFANGHDPFEYVKKVAEKGLLKLIHFNDSKDVCGSCKDRHAFIGKGNIDLNKLIRIAEYANTISVPLVIE